MIKKTVCIIFCILSAVCFASCSALPDSEETLSFYEKEVVDGITDNIGSLDRLPGISEDVCVIENEAMFDENLFSVGHAGLFSESDKRVLYSKKAFEKVFPASLTKCMTALLVLENCPDLEAVVTVGPEVSLNLTDGASLAGLSEGESMTVRDLLTSLLIPSGNDAANVLAVHVSGSVDAFVELMNTRAYELCMLNTHFANPHGLHNDQHYTTVYDLYLLVRECLRHSEFKDIASRAESTVTGTFPDGSARDHFFKSTNSFLRKYTVPPNELYVSASKTGYTVQAGHNLILAVEDVMGNSYIAIITKAGSYDELYLQMNALLSVIGQ